MIVSILLAATLYLPCEEFKLGSATTEQVHPLTQNLSQTFHRNVREGLELLLRVDEGVLDGLESFVPTAWALSLKLSESLNQGGRIYLVGSGSSGRVAVDLAAKCNHPQIKGVIAGGDSAMIRAKEGFEDSEKEGREAFSNENLNSNDAVIMISANGSASFNVGCGHFAADRNASVYYFFNSKTIPSRTQGLFDRGVIPLLVDIGPQAIAGSTRLQGATLAEAALGSVLLTVFALCDGDADAMQTPQRILMGVADAQTLVRDNLGLIEELIRSEAAVFSDPEANFRKLEDESLQGYVTFLAGGDSIREILIDSTETSPNPIRRKGEPGKRPEFDAFFVGSEEGAWQTILGRDPEDLDARQYILSTEIAGAPSFAARPTGPGNLVIGVAKREPSEDLLSILDSVEGNKALLVLKDAPQDRFGLIESIALKQMLNLVSNGSMILMNKVVGNRIVKGIEAGTFQEIVETLLRNHEQLELL